MKEKTLWHYLKKVSDHRSRHGQRYSLQSILGLAIAAALGGNTSLYSIAQWARSLDPKFLRLFGIKRSAPPCQSTFHYVFTNLNIQDFEQMLSLWVKSILLEKYPGHVAIDGKRLRGSRSGEEYPGVHLLAAYCETVSGVVEQLCLNKGESEITAALRLLKEMPLKGVIVTGDAIFTQKEICQTIIAGGGDYFFTVKANQPQLQADIQAAFKSPGSPL